MDGLHALATAAKLLNRSNTAGSSGSKRKNKESQDSTGGPSGAKKPKQTSPNPFMHGLHGIVQRKIEPSAFVNKKLKISELQSKKIVVELKSAGFLSEDGDVNKNNSGLESYVRLLEDVQTTAQLKFILDVLDSNPSIPQRKIEPRAFVNEWLDISELQSSKNFKQLKDLGVLSEDGYVKKRLRLGRK